MVIGIPREVDRHEHRVGLNPAAVSRLTQQGHEVFVESRAGESAHFADRDYQKAGGQVAYGADEVYKRADMVCRVDKLTEDDLGRLRQGAVVCGFHHMAVASRTMVEQMMELKATLVGYEVIRDADGERPVLFPLSEMTGTLAIQLAAYYLQNETGGRGVLMGNVPGVPPPTVLILGAGAVGRSAARQALATGAHVIVSDVELKRLADINRNFEGHVVTVLAAEERIDRYTKIADVVIGAVLSPGRRAPFVVTEPMVRKMKPGSIIIDVSIDEGGCVETSRPTTLDSPTFVRHGVIHYCVPNMTANIARTASRVLANAALPYVSALADRGVDGALREDPGLAAGVYLYRGCMVNELVGETLGLPATPLRQIMGGAGW